MAGLAFLAKFGIEDPPATINERNIGQTERLLTYQKIQYQNP